MIKGINGHGYADELVVPIIENTAREYELTDSLAAAVRAPPPHQPPMAPSLSYASPHMCADGSLPHLDSRPCAQPWPVCVGR